MIALIWNCRGIGQPSAVRVLRNYVISHRPLLLFLSKVKCMNFDIISNIIVSLGFSKFEFVPAIGKSGGLLLAWKDCVDLSVIVAKDNFINCIIHNSPMSQP